MKKIAIIPWILILCFALCGCGDKDNAEGMHNIEQLSVPAEDIPVLSSEESLRMANHMARNRAFVSGDMLYCFDFDENFLPVLSAYEIGKGEPGGRRILAENCVPEHLTEYDGNLYYINIADGGSIESIKTDGEDRTVLRSGRASWLQVNEGYAYFCDENGRFCRMELSGENEQVLYDGRCCYAYLIGNTLIYQNENDGERLYIRSLESGEESPLSSGAAYAPVIFGDSLYYSGSDTVHVIHSSRLEAERLELPQLYSAAEVYPVENGVMIRGISDENGLYQWTASLNLAIENASYSGYRACEWLGENCRVDTTYNTDGRIRCFVYTNSQMEAKEFIAGKFISGGE